MDTKTHALYVQSVVVIDPDTKNEVSVDIYKDIVSGAIFGIDASYEDTVYNGSGYNENEVSVYSPYNAGYYIVLGE